MLSILISCYIHVLCTLRYILTLCAHLYLGLPRDFLPSGFPTSTHGCYILRLANFRIRYFNIIHMSSNVSSAQPSWSFQAKIFIFYSLHATCSNMASHSTEGTHIGGVWEQGAAKNTWSYGEVNNRRVRKLHNLYGNSSTKFIKAVKSVKVRLAGHAAQTETW
jgi:hypothetical protein